MNPLECDALFYIDKCTIDTIHNNKLTTRILSMWLILLKFDDCHTMPRQSTHRKGMRAATFHDLKPIHQVGQGQQCSLHCGIMKESR